MAKQTFTKIILVCCVLLGLSTASYADPFTFSTIPTGGNVSGIAGSTIGWGYTITNLSTNWLMTTSLSADLFQNGTPNAFLFDFPILAPGAMLTVAFDALAGTGLYGLTWDATAPVGFTSSGTFLLSGEFWDADPFAGGNFISAAADQSTAYLASVSAGSTAPNPVPEPSTLILLGSGLAAVLANNRSKKITRFLPTLLGEKGITGICSDAAGPVVRTSIHLCPAFQTSKRGKA